MKTIRHFWFLGVLAVLGIVGIPTDVEAQLVLCKFCNTENGTSYTCSNDNDPSYAYCDGTFFGLWCWTCEEQANAVPAKFSPTGSVPSVLGGTIDAAVLRDFGAKIADGVFVAAGGCRMEVGAFWYDEVAAAEVRTALSRVTL